MATLADITVRVSTRLGALQKGLADAEKRLARSARRMQRTAEQLNVSVTLPIAAFGAAALKSSADIERLELGMTNMLGSAEAARRELALLAEAAKLPGLGFQQAVRGSLQLQAVGVSADEARRQLAEFGNAIASAGGSASDLDGVALALTQISAADKLLTQDVRQLTSRIPQLATIFQETFGTSIPQEIAEGLEKAGVSNAEFVEIVTDKLGELPRATGGLGNAFENFGNTVGRALATVGTSINEAFDVTGKVDDLAGAIAGAADAFAALPKFVKSATLVLAAMAAAIGPVLTGIAGFNLVRAQLAGAGSTLVGLAKSVSAAVLSRLVPALTAARTAFVGLNLAAKLTVVGAVIGIAIAAASAFSSLGRSVSAAEEAQTRLASVVNSATASVAGQEARVRALAGVIEDSTSSDDDKAKALEKLKRVSGTYFGSLQLAEGSVDGLKDATDGYTEALVRNARAQGIANAIQEAQQELSDLRDAGADTGFFNSLREQFDGIISGDFGSTVGERVERGFAAAQSRIETRITSLTSDLNALVAAGAGEDLAPGGLNLDFGKVEEDADALQRRLNRAFAQNPLPLRIEPDFDAFAAIDAALPDPGPLVLEVDDRITTSLDAVAPRLQALGVQMGQIETLNGALGDSFDAPAAKTQALTAAIRDLVGAGLTEFSPQVQALVADLQALPQPLTEAEEAVAQFGQRASAIAEQTLESLVGAFAEGLAGLADGSLTAGQALGGLLDVLARGLQQMGKLIVSYGITVKAFQNAFANPVAAVIAGGALIAAGALVRAQAQKLQAPPKLARGGLAYGPTLAVVGDNPGARANPEVIAPLDKLKAIMGEGGGGAVRVYGELVARGPDLHAVLDDSRQRYSRTR